MSITFTTLGINSDLIAALAKNAITTPTPIQIAAIPLLLGKNDAYLQAETGTGKTLAYLLPLYSKIDTTLANVQVIVVAPTHELAIQIQRQCADLSQQSGLPIRVVLLIGGASPDRQLEKLKKKPHVVVGSPGRIRELIEARKLKTHLVHTIVMDEADRLLTTEKLADLQPIIKSAPQDRSLVFVSATEHHEIAKTVTSLASTVIKINAAAAPVNPNIEHRYLRCDERDKPEFVRKLIHAMAPNRTIVFVHKNDAAEMVASKLEHHKLSVVDIHGALNREDRKNAMEQIRNGKAAILIASDVAARGLDIKGVTLVVNLDIPSDSGAYLHRVGRTGRAGEKGIAVSLISGDQAYLVDRFKKDLGISLTEVYLRDGELHTMETVKSPDSIKLGAQALLG